MFSCLCPSNKWEFLKDKDLASFPFDFLAKAQCLAQNGARGIQGIEMNQILHPFTEKLKQLLATNFKMYSIHCEIKIRRR